MPSSGHTRDPQALEELRADRFNRRCPHLFPISLWSPRRGWGGHVRWKGHNGRGIGIVSRLPRITQE